MAFQRAPSRPSQTRVSCVHHDTPTPDRVHLDRPISRLVPSLLLAVHLSLTATWSGKNAETDRVFWKCWSCACPDRPWGSSFARPWPRPWTRSSAVWCAACPPDRGGFGVWFSRRTFCLDGFKKKTKKKIGQETKKTNEIQRVRNGLFPMRANDSVKH